MMEKIIEINLDTPYEKVKEFLEKFYGFHDGHIVSFNMDCKKNTIEMRVEVEYDWDNHIFGQFLFRFGNFRYCQFHYLNINVNDFDLDYLDISINRNYLNVILEPMHYPPFSQIHCRKIECELIASCKTDDWKKVFGEKEPGPKNDLPRHIPRGK